MFYFCKRLVLIWLLFHGVIHGSSGDKRGFLIGSQLPGGELDHRMPDAIGNLYKTTDCSDKTYGASGQLLTEKTTEGTNTYTYDAFGRRLTKSYKGNKTCFLWDGNVMLHQWV